MTQPNLFTRLEGYGRENFTTEALAHILESDISLRRAFIGMLLKEKKPRLLKKFKDYTIDTQIPHDVGQPDMELTSCSDQKTKVFVEVKTGAPLGDGQLEKYGELPGYTAYLTPHWYARPSHYDKNGRFLGHFFWRDVCDLITQRKSHNLIQQQFLKYLETRHMAPTKPITKGELDSAAQAVEFINKSWLIVDSVRKRIMDEWHTMFGENVGAKSTLTYPFAQGSFPYWWFRPETWQKNDRKFYLSIGIALNRDRKIRPAFFICVGSSKKRFWNDEVETKLEEQIQKLKDRGWVRSKPTDDEIEYYKYYSLKAGEKTEDMIDEQVENVHKAMKDLRTLKLLPKIQKLL